MITLSFLGLVAIIVASAWVGYVVGSVLAMNRLLAQLQRAGFRVTRKRLEVARVTHARSGDAHEEGKK